MCLLVRLSGYDPSGVPHAERALKPPRGGRPRTFHFLPVSARTLGGGQARRVRCL